MTFSAVHTAKFGWRANWNWPKPSPCDTCRYNIRFLIVFGLLKTSTQGLASYNVHGPCWGNWTHYYWNQFELSGRNFGRLAMQAFSGITSLERPEHCVNWMDTLHCCRPISFYAGGGGGGWLIFVCVINVVWAFDMISTCIFIFVDKNTITMYTYRTCITFTVHQRKEELYPYNILSVFCAT